MVFVGCTTIGMKLSKRLSERQHALLKLVDIILNLKSQMCGLGVPLFTAFENIGNESIGGVWANIFMECSRIMKEEHLDSGLAWKKAITSYKAALPLDQADIDMLMDFGEMLGKSGRQDQESVLELEKEKLMAMEKKARETVDSKGRLYRNLGVLSGAAVVILLI